jgi:hypothetical protein
VIPPVFHVFLSPAGVMKLLSLHDRCILLHNSIWQFWASVWLMSDSTRWHEPFREYLSRQQDGSVNLKPAVWYFELVIRPSKVKQLAFFQASPLVDRTCVEQLPAVWGFAFFGCCWSCGRTALAEKLILLSMLLERVKHLTAVQHESFPGRYTTLGLVILSFDAFWWGPVVH